MSVSFAATLATNIASFEATLTKFAKSIPADLVKPFRDKIALDLFTDLVMNTPVDTGNAKGGWQVSVDTPTDNVRIRKDKQGNLTVKHGLAKINSATNPYSLLYLQNNVPYIIPLDKGHSKQKPNGFISQALARLETSFS